MASICWLELQTKTLELDDSNPLLQDPGREATVYSEFGETSCFVAVTGLEPVQGETVEKHHLSCSHQCTCVGPWRDFFLCW
ncbi:hypothetical protein YC2023_008718 [Brassica napus]